MPLNSCIYHFYRGYHSGIQKIFPGVGGGGFRRLFEFFGGPGGRGPRHNLFKFLFVNFIM